MTTVTGSSIATNKTILSVSFGIPLLQDRPQKPPGKQVIKHFTRPFSYFSQKLGGFTVKPRLKNITITPCDAVQKSFFEPVKDRWGICVPL